MSLQTRAYDEPKDRQALEDLFASYRNATGTSAYPTYWRLRLLLSSRLAEPDLDSRIWYDANGKPAGLALLWSRSPEDGYRALERVPDPAEPRDLPAAMIAWAIERASTVSRKASKPIDLYASALPSPLETTEELEGAGFSLLHPDPASFNVYYSRDLSIRLPASSPPPDFQTVFLDATADLPRYESVYHFTAVAPEHRKALLQSSEYEHIVLLDQTGSPVSYCECSVWRREWVGKSPPTGWIDYVGSVEMAQRRGHAKEVLTAALVLLKEWGAERAMLITVSSNAAANALFASAGFRSVSGLQPPIFQRSLSPTPATRPATPPHAA